MPKSSQQTGSAGSWSDMVTAANLCYLALANRPPSFDKAEEHITKVEEWATRHKQKLWREQATRIKTDCQQVLKDKQEEIKIAESIRDDEIIKDALNWTPSKERIEDLKEKSKVLFDEVKVQDPQKVSNCAPS